MSDNSYGNVDESPQIILDQRQNNEKREQQYTEEPDVDSDGSPHEKLSENTRIDELFSIDETRVSLKLDISPFMSS